MNTIGPIEKKCIEYRENIYNAYGLLLLKTATVDVFEMFEKELNDGDIPVFIKDDSHIMFAMGRGRIGYNLLDMYQDDNDEFNMLINKILLDKYPSIETLCDFLTALIKDASDDEIAEFRDMIKFVKRFKMLLCHGQYNFSSSMNIFNKDKTPKLNKTVLITDVCKLDLNPTQHTLSAILYSNNDNREERDLYIGSLMDSKMTIQ